MTVNPRQYPPVSLARAAFACRCPRCGEGRLFAGVLAVRAACPSCALDFSAEDAGDGPQVFVIFFLGLIVVLPSGAKARHRIFELERELSSICNQAVQKDYGQKYLYYAE